MLVHWWYVIFLLVPSFSLSKCIRFFRSCHFFRGLIFLFDALLVLISHFHSTTGHAPFQGPPKFQQGFFSLHPIPSLFKEKMPWVKKRWIVWPVSSSARPSPVKDSTRLQTEAGCICWCTTTDGSTGGSTTQDCVRYSVACSPHRSRSIDWWNRKAVLHRYPGPPTSCEIDVNGRVWLALRYLGKGDSWKKRSIECAWRRSIVWV